MTEEANVGYTQPREEVHIRQEWKSERWPERLIWLWWGANVMISCGWSNRTREVLELLRLKTLDKKWVHFNSRKTLFCLTKGILVRDKTSQKGYFSRKRVKKKSTIHFFLQIDLLLFVVCNDLKVMVWNLRKSAYLLSGWELDEKVDTTFMFVCTIWSRWLDKFSIRLEAGGNS